MATVVLVSLCENRHYILVGNLWNDYHILFVEIVRPSLDIEDADEFLAYFTTEEILQKVAEAEGILEEIDTIITERNLDFNRPSSQMMQELRHLTTLQERFQDSDADTRYRVVNGTADGLFGYRGHLRLLVIQSERSIEMYNECFGDR